MTRLAGKFRPKGGDLSIPAQVTPARARGKLVRTGNSTVRALRRAAAEAGRLDLSHHEILPSGKVFALPKAIDQSGDCMFPVYVGLHGRAASNPIHDIPWDREYVLERRPEYQDMTVRCRKCPKCLAHRSKMWAARACVELLVPGRNWFGTLTLAPGVHDRHLWLCRQRFHLRGGAKGCRTFDDQPSDIQFQQRAKLGGEEITKYLKRVRKEAKARFRYLLVTEAHKSGLPHWHVLLHERDVEIRKRTLDGQWSSLGFPRWRIADAGPETAFYLSKYLAKDALTRIRASAGYGRITNVGGKSPHAVAQQQARTQPSVNATTEEGEENAKLFLSTIMKWGWGHFIIVMVEGDRLETVSFISV